MKKLLLIATFLISAFGFSQTMVEIKGASEQFVLTNTANPRETPDAWPAARIVAKISEERQKERILILAVDETGHGRPFGKPDGYLLTELVDETGAPFDSLDDAFQWFLDNTGKSKAGGSLTGNIASDLQSLRDSVINRTITSNDGSVTITQVAPLDFDLSVNTGNPNSNLYSSSATVINTDNVLDNQNAVDGEHRKFSVTGTGTRPFTSTLPINLNINGTLTTLAAGSTFNVPAGAFGYYFRTGGQLWFSYQTQGTENGDASNINGAPQDLSANLLSLLPDRVAWHFHIRQPTTFTAGGDLMNVTVDGENAATGVTSHTVPDGAQGFAIRVGTGYQVNYLTSTDGEPADTQIVASVTYGMNVILDLRNAPDNTAQHFQVYNPSNPSTLFQVPAGNTLQVVADGVLTNGTLNNAVPNGAQGFYYRNGTDYTLVYQTVGSSGISADADNLLTLGSDNLPYLTADCTDVTEQFVTGATSNPGSTPPSGILVTEITVNKTQNITVVHTGTGFSGSAGSGWGIADAPMFATANSIALANVYSSTGDRIDAATPSKTYTVSLTAGTYYIGVWSGGLSGVTSHTLDITYCKPSVNPDTYFQFVENRCYQASGTALAPLVNAAYLDEINPTQLATLPTGAHMRWTAPSATVLDNIELHGFGGATAVISWTTSSGQSGSGSVTYDGTNPEILNLGNIALGSGDTIDFTLESLTAGQMQLTNAATSTANGWTALQDYSAFANSSHWASTLNTSTANIEYSVNVFEDENGATIYKEVVGEDLIDLASIPNTWTLCAGESQLTISQDAGNITILKNGELYTLPLKSETCYEEPSTNAPRPNSLFTLNNFDGNPTVSPPVVLGTSQTFYDPDKQVFFDLSKLPAGARIKTIRMYDYRAGNNTAAISHSYNGVNTNAVSPALHPNGFSAAPVEYTFATSQPLVDGVPLIVNNPSQNTTDQGQGLGSDWIASITAGTATASGSNSGVTSVLDGFNAEVDFEITQGGNFTVREYSDGTTTKLIYFDALGNPFEITQIPTTWAACVETEEGLRGTPVPTNADLTALPARDYERRKVDADGKEYVFELGATTGTLADDAGTGFWVEQFFDGAPLESAVVKLPSTIDLSGSSPGVFQDVLTLTVPGAGRWRLEATISGQVGNGVDDTQGIYSRITDNANNVVSDADVVRVVGDWDNAVLNSTQNKAGTVTYFAYVTTTGAETFKLQASQQTDAHGHFILPETSFRYEQQGVYGTSSTGGSDDDITAVTFDGTNLTVEEGTTSFSADISGLDTNTQLTKVDIEAMGFVDGAHTVDTDTQLTEAEVDAFVNNNGYSTGAHTVDTNTQRDAGVGLTLNGNALDVDTNNAIFGNFDKDVSDDFDGAFTSLTGVPTGLSDGDDDTIYDDTALQAQVTANDGDISTLTTNVAANATAIAAISDTDNQNIENLGLSGANILTVGIENGTSQTVDLSGLVSTDDQNASEVPFTATGNTTSTTTQAAIVELQTEIDGLVSGGSDDDITAVSFDGTNLTVTEGATSFSADISGVDTDTVYDDTAIQAEQTTQNTNIANNTTAIAAINEESTTVSDTPEIDLTLATNDISGTLVVGSIDETKLDVSTNASLDLADSALQSGDNISTLNNDAGYITTETDDQNIEDLALSGTNVLTVGIENGTNQTVDLSSLVSDGSETNITVGAGLVITGNGTTATPYNISLQPGIIKVPESVYNDLTAAEIATGLYEERPVPPPTINFFQEGDGTEANPTANIADAIANGEYAAITDGAGNVVQLFDPNVNPISVAELESWAVSEFGAGTTVDPTTYEINPADGSTANVAGYFDETKSCKVLTTPEVMPRPTPVEVLPGQYTWTYPLSGVVITATNTETDPYSYNIAGSFVTALPQNAVLSEATLEFSIDVSNLNTINGCAPQVTRWDSRITDIDEDPGFVTVNNPLPPTFFATGSFTESPANTYTASNTIDSNMQVLARYFNVTTNESYTMDYGVPGTGDQIGYITDLRIKQGVEAIYLNGGAYFVTATSQDGNTRTEAEIENP